MKIYIVDCDRTSRSELKNMIEVGNLGTIVGASPRWEEAYLRLQEVGPDVVLADLEFSTLKSMVYIGKVKAVMPETAVVVLSQAAHPETLRQAYEKGAELVLHKPLNQTEVRNVLYNLEMARAMKWLLSKAGPGAGREESGDRDRGAPKAPAADSGPPIRRLRGILQEIGVLSDCGSRDILGIVRYMIEEDIELQDITLRELCGKMGENPKSVEQRIRRTAAAGMANLAARGMEDYADPVFNEYAVRLYSSEQIRREMNYIRGRSEQHGNVRVRRFLGGLLECCREE
ncbi:MAG: DNA-binding domain-containing protein [Enterocloster asparagiformis]|nr:DNA-binding domain-containing protein [Enterocloster asparagiformis]